MNVYTVYSMIFAQGNISVMNAPRANYDNVIAFSPSMSDFITQYGAERAGAPIVADGAIFTPWTIAVTPAPMPVAERVATSRPGIM
jgi:hypothetical protein